MKRRTTTVVASLVAAPLLVGSLTACNGDAKKDSGKAADSTKDAKTRVHDAYDKTMDTKKLETSMRLGLDDETIDVLDSSSGSSKTKPNEKKLLEDSRLVMTTSSTGGTLKDEKDPSKGNVAITWRTDSDLATLTVIGSKTMYAKVDLAKIGQLTESSDVKNLKSQVAGAPSWVRDFIDGKPLGIEMSTLQDVAKASGATPSATPGQQQLSADQQQQMRDALRKNEDANVTYSGDGDHVKATVKLKPFVNTFAADAHRIAPQQFTDSSVQQLTKSMNGLKDDATVDADITLSDDKVKTVSMDIMQIVAQEKNPSADDKKTMAAMKAKGKTLPMIVDLSEASSEVAAPSDAHMITQQEVQQLMGGMRSGV